MFKPSKTSQELCELHLCHLCMKDFDHKLRVFKTVVQQGPFTQIIVQDSYAKYVDWCRGTRGQGGEWKHRKHR